MVVGEFVKLQIGNRGARRWRTDEGWGVDDEGLGEVKVRQSEERRTAGAQRQQKQCIAYSYK